MERGRQAVVGFDLREEECVATGVGLVKDEEKGRPRGLFLVRLNEVRVSVVYWEEEEIDIQRRSASSCG